MKIQTMVLEEIYLSEGNQDVKTLTENTGLKTTQVHTALISLRCRGLIYKKKQSSNATKNIPPENKIFVNVNDNVLDRIRTVIANG